jgi:transcription elongation factor GreA
MSNIPTVSRSLLIHATVYGRPLSRHQFAGRAQGPPHTLRLGSMTNDVHITPEGLQAVRQELDELTTVRRPAIVAKIKAAREFGDLSENFEYHAAKNEQGMMEARVKELEQIIKNHVLIETRAATGVVGMGSTVRFSEAGADEETYRIVGPAEADPKAGRVSYESALGKALIGHRVGEEVEIITPNGTYSVRIVGIA